MGWVGVECDQALTEAELASINEEENSDDYLLRPKNTVDTLLPQSPHQTSTSSSSNDQSGSSSPKMNFTTFMDNLFSQTSRNIKEYG